jgi:large subunit ribosomal protein L19
MEAIKTLELAHRKHAIPAVQSGDTVRVHQQIREGNKTRVQIFEGVVIRTHRMQELTASVTVRRIASGVGVEKTFLLHSPNIVRVDVVRRAKVRRNFLSYLRQRRGKSARLQELAFDKASVNAANNAPVAEVKAEEVDADLAEDALNDAVPLDEEVKAEEQAAAKEDQPEATEVAVADEQQLGAEEFAAGVEKAHPGEGEAVEDNPVVDKPDEVEKA